MEISKYPRDMATKITLPILWPNGARLAVQFVLNYEEGGENNILHRWSIGGILIWNSRRFAPWVGKKSEYRINI